MNEPQKFIAGVKAVLTGILYIIGLIFAMGLFVVISGFGRRITQTAFDSVLGWIASLFRWIFG